MSLLSDLRHGRDLRHMPVALRSGDRSAVVAIVERRDGSWSRVEHVPVALHPLTIALRSDDGPLDDAVRLLMRHIGDPAAGERRDDPASDGRDRSTDAHRHGGSSARADAHGPRDGSAGIGANGPDGSSAMITLGPSRPLEIGGLRLSLCEPATGKNGFQPQPHRAWTYLLAWRRAMKIRGTPGGLGMSARELRALDCYYVWPRPVHLVGVRHGDRSNLFPMDLVGPLGDGRFTLALRTRSPSVETMKESRRVVLSVAPAAWKDTVYQLGAHHRRTSIDTAALPFRLRSSRNFDLPVPDAAPGYLEIDIQDALAIGSHTFFVGTVIHTEHAAPDRVAQLAHVSALYAGWRRRRGDPFLDA